MSMKNILDKEYIKYMKDNLELFGKYYAESKDELGDVTPEVKDALRKFTEKLYNVLTEEVSVKFVEDEPYDYLSGEASDMMGDFVKGFVRVPTNGDDSAIFGEYNLKFRATHDIIHCLLNKNFTYDEEFDTFIYTARLFKLWNETLYPNEIDKAIRVLRSEIVYQSAFKNSSAENVIEQKVILSDPE